MLSSNSSPNQCLGRRGLEKLDLLILLTESLDLNGSQAMLTISHQIGLKEKFPNLVEIWKYRCHNPLRKVSRKGLLKYEDTQALIQLLCAMSERIHPICRQLLSSKEPVTLTKMRWESLNKRFKDLIIERMNIRRGSIKKIIDDENFPEMSRNLVRILLFCSGQGGLNRLRSFLLEEPI